MICIMRCFHRKTLIFITLFFRFPFPVDWRDACRIFLISTNFLSILYIWTIFFKNLCKRVFLVPTPALTAYEGTEQDKSKAHFCYLLDGSEMSESVKKKAMTKKGSIAIGEPLLDDWSKCPHIDLVVVGAVAVTTSGRRLGKGGEKCGFIFRKRPLPLIFYDFESHTNLIEMNKVNLLLICTIGYLF